MITINERKQSWFCFGCERGGDVFEFVEPIDKQTSGVPSHIAAEIANVDLPNGRAGGGNALHTYVLHELDAGGRAGSC